ncbi:hypothetical protein WG66_013229 [Moniliophthora roreri]|nr:hypothetical protein WG66_013229 [Moniliophthora roreri]
MVYSRLSSSRSRSVSINPMTPHLPASLPVPSVTTESTLEDSAVSASSPTVHGASTEPFDDNSDSEAEAEHCWQWEALLHAKLRKISAEKTRRLHLKNDRIMELEQEKTALEATNNKLQSQLWRAQQESDSFKAQMEERRNEFHFDKAMLETENDVLGVKLQQAQQEIRVIKAEMGQKVEELQVLEQMVSLATSEGNEARSENARLKRLVKKLRAENMELRDDKIRLIEERARNDEEKMKALQALTTQLFSGKASHLDSSICSTPSAKKRKCVE